VFDIRRYRKKEEEEKVGERKIGSHPKKARLYWVVFVI